MTQNTNQPSDRSDDVIAPMGTLAGEIKWYEDAYSDPKTRVERGYYWDSKPSALVDKLFQSYKGERERALDVACGDGPHLEWLKDQGFKDVWGVDMIDSALAAATERVPGATLINADLTAPGSIKEAGEFDLLVLHSITDHMRPIHRPAFFDNLREAIKPGGSIIMVEFAPGLVGIPEGQNWKDVGGHYSSVLTHEELEGFLPGFTTTERISGPISDLHPETIMNGVLLQKPE